MCPAYLSLSFSPIPCTPPHWAVCCSFHFLPVFLHGGMPFSYRSTCWKIKSDTAFKDWGWELEYMLRITDLKAHFTVVSLKDMTSIENILAPYLRTRVDAGVHVMKAWYWGILISFHSSHSFLNHSIIILKRSPMLYC